jgi:glutaredoxin-like protein
MMLSEGDRASLERKFAQGMKEDITLLLIFDEGSAIAKELIDLANTLSQITPKIKVDIEPADGGKNPRMRQLHIEHWPCLVLVKGDFARIRYYGIPAGYELPSLIDAIVELSSTSTPLSPKAKSALATVRRRANIKIFILTTCQFCPTVARHAYRGAIESPRVTAEIFDSHMFPDLATRHSVMGVPKIILNDNLDITGAITDVEFFDKLRDSDHALIDSIYG